MLEMSLSNFTGRIVAIIESRFIGDTKRKSPSFAGSFCGRGSPPPVQDDSTIVKDSFTSMINIAHHHTLLDLLASWLWKGKCFASSGPRLHVRRGTGHFSMSVSQDHTTWKGWARGEPIPSSCLSFSSMLLIPDRVIWWSHRQTPILLKALGNKISHLMLQ